MKPPTARSKQWILPIICFVIVAGILLVSLVRPSTPQQTGEPGSNETQPVQWPSKEVKKEVIKDNGKGYRITATYPVTQSTTINDYFYTFVNDQINTFKQDTAAIADAPDELPNATMDISYVEQPNELADNYIFAIYTDTGGAHGFQATTTFAFDEQGKPLTLEDLFVNPEQGLASVATYAMTELSKNELTNDEWVKDGAGPTAENYRSFVIEPTGDVTFIFDPYQVAAYAAGTLRVTVPLDTFERWANPEVFK